MVFNIILVDDEARLRRTKEENSEIYYKGLIWDKEHYFFSYNHKIISLTRKEFELIGLFLKSTNQVFSRGNLIGIAWGTDTDTEKRTVDSHMQNGREELNKEGFPIESHLQTVCEVECKWVDEG